MNRSITEMMSGWYKRTGRAPSLDAKLQELRRIPECAKRQMRHMPYGGGENIELAEDRKTGDGCENISPAEDRRADDGCENIALAEDRRIYDCLDSTEQGEDRTPAEDEP